MSAGQRKRERLVGQLGLGEMMLPTGSQPTICNLAFESVIRSRQGRATCLSPLACEPPDPGNQRSSLERRKDAPALERFLLFFFSFLYYFKTKERLGSDDQWLLYPARL